VAALAWSALGGAVLSFFQVPLAWMLGALSFSAVASLMVPGLKLHTHVRYVGQLGVGASVGLGFQAAVIAALVSLLPLMFLITTLTIIVAIGMSFLFARLARIDGTTAFFASMPGGVAEMVTLAERHGGNPMLVSLSQSLRIFLTVATVPLLVSLIHPPSGAGPMASPGSWSYGGVLMLLGAALLGAVLIDRLRIPNAWLLGGIAAGCLFANFDLGVVEMPALIVIVAQIMIGTALGLRFKRNAGVGMRRFTLVTVGMTTLVIATSIGFGVLLSWMFRLDLDTVVLALAPGGASEMGITALSIGADASLVTAVHLLRIVAVALFSLPLYMGVRKIWLAKHEAADQ
jgi:uncharacterized protein